MPPMSPNFEKKNLTRGTSFDMSEEKGDNNSFKSAEEDKEENLIKR